MARLPSGRVAQLLWTWRFLKRKRAALETPSEGGDGTALDFSAAENSMHINTVLY